MKRITMAFFAIALIGALSAFTSKTEVSLSNKKFVGEYIDGGTYFIKDDPSQAGMQPWEVTSLVKGTNYDCVTGELCTVTVSELVEPEFDENEQLFYVETIVSTESGEFDPIP